MSKEIKSNVNWLSIVRLWNWEEFALEIHREWQYIQIADSELNQFFEDLSNREDEED